MQKFRPVSDSAEFSRIQPRANERVAAHQEKGKRTQRWAGFIVSKVSLAHGIASAPQKRKFATQRKLFCHKKLGSKNCVRIVAEPEIPRRRPLRRAVGSIVWLLLPGTP